MEFAQFNKMEQGRRIGRRNLAHLKTTRISSDHPQRDLQPLTRCILHGRRAVGLTRHDEYL